MIEQLLKQSDFNIRRPDSDIDGWVCKHKQGEEWADGCCTDALAGMVSICDRVQRTIKIVQPDRGLLKLYLLLMQALVIPES